MSISQQVQQKIYRLETLRKYQAYYGPNTPYQIVAEINQLEAELRRMLQADLTRRTQTVQPKAKAAKKPKRPTKKRPVQPQKKQAGRRKGKRKKGLFGLSRATRDAIAIITFIGFVFLLGAIVFAAYVRSQEDGVNAFSNANVIVNVQPTLRPTFTPTPDPNNPNPPPPAEEPISDAIEVAAVENSNLPSPNKVPTQIPTPVPTLTPSPAPEPTNTPTPLPTETPLPTQPSQLSQPPPPPPSTATAAPPTNTPAPSYRFTVREQGNREFQKTNYHVITIYVAIVSAGNIPIGGMKIVGDHSSGMHAESGLSDWNWSATNCLDCDYVKFANVKFEPGTFTDGVWNIYVADEAGNKLSPTVPLSYSSDPDQWVWDFIIFSES